MQIRIGLEHHIKDRTQAWALDYPGCFSYGSDSSEALVNLPRALLNYQDWIRSHTLQPWITFSDLDLLVVDQFTTYFVRDDFSPAPIGEGYEVNAWFIDDWRPLSNQEIEQCLLIFNWQRAELMAGLSTLPAEVLDQEHPGERWPITGIAKHIANAELFYLQRLDLVDFTRKDMSPDVIHRLDQTSALVNQTYPLFSNQVNVRGVAGEFWSYRKIIRRTLWHQRDHIDHIKQLAFKSI